MTLLFLRLKRQGLFTVFKEWNKVECLQSAVSLASAAQYSPLSRRAAPTGGAVAESLPRFRCVVIKSV